MSAFKVSLTDSKIRADGVLNTYTFKFDDLGPTVLTRVPVEAGDIIEAKNKLDKFIVDELEFTNC